MTAAWTTPAKDWSTSEVLTAALMDTHLRDNMDYLNQEFVAKLGQWTSHVPTLLQSATVSKTVTYSRYLKIGRHVTYEWDLAITSSGTANNIITISLPVNAANANIFGGRIVWYDASATAFFAADCYTASGTTVAGTWDGFATGPGQTTTGKPNQLVSGDVLRGHIIYESAS